MCTADRTSSPWHNFVSDTDRWVVMNEPSHGLDFSWRSWSIFWPAVYYKNLYFFAKIVDLNVWDWSSDQNNKPFQLIMWYVEFWTFWKWVLNEVAFFLNLKAQNSMYHLFSEMTYDFDHETNLKPFKSTI